jgi:hypothetical protein
MKIIKENIYLLISCFSIILFVLGVQCAFYITSVNNVSGSSIVDILFPVFSLIGMIFAPLVGSLTAIISLFVEKKRILRILFLLICMSINFVLTAFLFFPYLLHIVRR